MEYDHSDISEVEIALIDNPYNIPALCKLGQWLVQEQDIHEACEVYNKIVRLDSQNERAWIALGHCNMLREHYQSSFCAYQTALSQHPKNAYLWFGIAVLYRKFNQIRYSKTAFKNALKADHHFEYVSEVYYNLGLIYKEMARYDKATDFLDRSLPSLSLRRKIEVLRHLGQCYENCTLYEKALSTYQEAVALDPENLKTLEYQGWCFYLNKQYELAIEVHQKALTVVENDPAEIGDLHYLIGRSYMELEDYACARNAFENALKNNQNSGIYWWSTAVLYEKVEKRNFAIEFIRNALDIDENNAELWFLLGVLYEKDQMLIDAAEAYQLAIENEFDPAVAFLNSVGEGNELPDLYHPEIYLSNRPFSVEYGLDLEEEEHESEDLNTEASSNIEDIEDREDEGLYFKFAWFLLNAAVCVLEFLDLSEFLPLRRGPTREDSQETQKVRRI